MELIPKWDNPVIFVRIRLDLQIKELQVRSKNLCRIMKVYGKFTMLWIDQKVRSSPFMDWLYHWLVMSNLLAPEQSQNAQTNSNGFLSIHFPDILLTRLREISLK